ncbi:MAG: diaminopimelate decarboxylase, partial [Leptospiraceae bacterium]|nr:diaminopimelate decarboxylase [Leptospiraceae bacterium]
MMEIEELQFLTPDLTRNIANKFGTPVFVYSQSEIENRCDIALGFPNAFGLTVRYAMKANPNASILKIMHKKGIHIDASSIHEVYRAIAAGFEADRILLTSQQSPTEDELKDIISKGVSFNACSLYQLELYGKIFSGNEVSVRINPGLGSGHTAKTDVGGVTSGFGIWHESIDEVKEIVKKYNLKVVRVHTHIGSGSDPEVWKAVSKYTLEYAEIFSDCEIVNLGGGYKVGRMKGEKSTNLSIIGEPVKKEFEEFFKKHNRKLKLEIEPGTHLIANCGAILSEVMDKIHTGKKGYEFLKLNTGMDANTRPSLYGSRHPMITVAKSGEQGEIKDFVIIGHCCESGDLFTQQMGGELETRPIRDANIGDFIVMEGAGA